MDTASVECWTLHKFCICLYSNLNECLQTLTLTSRNCLSSKGNTHTSQGIQVHPNNGESFFSVLFTVRLGGQRCVLMSCKVLLNEKGVM